MLLQTIPEEEQLVLEAAGESGSESKGIRRAADQRVVAYFSRKLKLETKEAEWTVSEAELHGMHETILHFRVYLQNGLEFEVIVDHEAQTFLKMASQTQNNKKLLRMMIELQERS